MKTEDKLAEYIEEIRGYCIAGSIIDTLTEKALAEYESSKEKPTSSDRLKFQNPFSYRYISLLKKTGG